MFSFLRLNINSMKADIVTHLVFRKIIQSILLTPLLFFLI